MSFAVGVAVFLVTTIVLMAAIGASSQKGVPFDDNVPGAAMGAVPVALLAFAAALAWMTPAVRVVAPVGLGLTGLLLWWLLTVAVPDYGRFYDSVDPHPDDCRDIPEDMICL